MCDKCQAKFGKMKKQDNNQMLTGVGLGGVAAVAGTKVIGRFAGEQKADSAETISGGGAAIAGFFIQDRAKKKFWKGFGLGMMGAGTFVAGSGLIGGAVDKAVDSVFGFVGGTPSTDNSTSTGGTTGLTAEQVLLNALNAQNNANVSVGQGTGGTNYLF